MTSVEMGTVRNIGVIFAGGVGSRMHRKDPPKQFLEIHNKPIIVHTIEYFEQNEQIDDIVVACVEDWIPYFRELADRFGLHKVRKIVPGGATGQLSIYNGLLAAEELADGQPAIVLIHDGVRPLISTGLLSKNIEDVRKYGSSVTSGTVSETIVEINDDDIVLNVPERAHTRVAKAPQCFYLHDILSAHRNALNDRITTFIDSCTMMRHYGFELHMTEGQDNNIKITTIEDYHMMQAILDLKETARQTRKSNEEVNR